MWSGYPTLKCPKDQVLPATVLNPSHAQSGMSMNHLVMSVTMQSKIENVTMKTASLDQFVRTETYKQQWQLHVKSLSKEMQVWDLEVYVILLLMFLSENTKEKF